jgi:hypothetical protein
MRRPLEGTTIRGLSSYSAPRPPIDAGTPSPLTGSLPYRIKEVVRDRLAETRSPDREGNLGFDGLRRRRRPHPEQSA